MPAATLDRFILESAHAHAGATGELSQLLMRFGVAGKGIAHEVAMAGLKRELGSAASTNIQGEEQKKLDVLANEILLETFDYGGLVSLAASDEMEQAFVYTHNAEEGRYAILFRPMDGSSHNHAHGPPRAFFALPLRADSRRTHTQAEAGRSPPTPPPRSPGRGRRRPRVDGASERARRGPGGASRANPALHRELDRSLPL